MMNKNILGFLLLFIISFTSFAQVKNDDKLMLAGEVAEYFSGNIMSGTSVKITSEGQYVMNAITDGKGEYEFFLDFEKDYQVLYEKAGFVPKKILVSTKGVPPKSRKKVADLVVEMTLFKRDKDLNVSFLRTTNW